MEHLLFVIGVLAAAASFAKLEIEIEGTAGWAADLPTWRLDNRWTRLVMGNRPLTGYHLWAHAFLFVAVHIPYALAFATPSWSAELRILAFLILFWMLEDFLWFVFNPDFGIRRFTREHIPWHARSWWWFMPREYWIFGPVAVGMYLASLRI